ncbi:MAG: methyltransferase domain-containing protein [Candidatus Omnitrophica bacterium]|nr:methyltransferase domain-containing protein [Candidatus Omnitrophota bacterium]
MDEQSREKDLRDLRARDYDHWYESVTGKNHGWVERETVKSFLNLRKDDVVLDAGCGTGRFSVEILAPEVKKVYCLDFSPTSIEVLQEKARRLALGNVEAQVADIKQPLPLAPASVDKTVSIQVIQHLSQEARLKALANIYEVLKPGGLAVVCVYNGSSIWQTWEKWRTGKKPLKEGYFGDKGIYYRRFSVEEIRDIFRAAGFRDVTVRGCINLPFYRRLDIRLFAMLDIFISKFSFSNRLGIFLACRGRK